MSKQAPCPQIIGHNSHRYRVIRDWGVPEAGKYPVNDCHEMVIDSANHIYLLTNEVKNNILVYDLSGRIIKSWGNDFPGGHGLYLFSENGEEFLFICDHVRHQVFKTTMDGRVLMIIDYPVETGAYASAEQFNPTETAIAPNGDIYVTDGYGLQYVIQYNSQGEYIRHWGGLGNADAQFDCVHGIAIDQRNVNEPSLLITSRNHCAFKRFSMDGLYMETINLPGSFVCRPVIKGENIYAAVLRSESIKKSGSGYIAVIDKNDKVISSPGGTEPVYHHNNLKPQQQATDTFIHPHDVCIDSDENIYVCQWNANKIYPIKLERI